MNGVIEVDNDLVDSSVRVEFMDHFRFDRISKTRLLKSLKNYSTNGTVSEVMDVTSEFVILQNFRSALNGNFAF